MSRSGESYHPPRASRSTSRRIQHDEIIDAIERYDPEAAARIVGAHLEVSRRHMAADAAPEGMEVPAGIWPPTESDGSDP